MQRHTLNTWLLTAAWLAGQHAQAQSTDSQQLVLAHDEIAVTTRSTTYNNSIVTKKMTRQQSPLNSVLAVIDNLPGVSIQEGDTYGFDDWSTTIAMRGFQVSLDVQQIGITIDGLPNGNSNYGGGSKANRYIDTGNLLGVEVSQGTADIGSMSSEALGGTLNFLTQIPEMDPRIRASASLGEFDAERYFFRYDTGPLFNSDSYAWISLSRQEATDWVNSSAENERVHVAAKFVSTIADTTELTAYFSYDDTHEDNYQRLFSAADFVNNPEWDQLTDEWTGLPYLDQLYRKGWSTLRDNLFAYIKLYGEVDEGLAVNGAVYAHRNYGRGDWVPPFLVNVTDDGAGNPESEFLGGQTVRGGPFLGRLYFVDAGGIALSPVPGCISSIRFPYGGAGPQSDPACHPDGAIPVQSYRHTHYEKERYGVTADFQWEASFADSANTLVGGIWYEDYLRLEWRDWHKITDTRVGFEFDEQPYWTQYNYQYPQTIFKWHLEDSVTLGPVTASFGVRQFLIDIKRRDSFRDSPNIEANSDSDVLFSGGLVYEGPVEGLQFFAGYAENFSAFSDSILEPPASDFSNLEPETADNYDVGLRYNCDRLTTSLAYYKTKFSNRLTFLDNQSVAGPDFLIGSDGTYSNAGGIESDGFELLVAILVAEELSLYAAYTYNDSTYLGTGEPLVDAEVGITPGNKVVNQPGHMLVLSADYANGPYRAGISAKYTDDRFIRSDNTWAADDYILTDLYIGVSGEDLGGALRGFDARLVFNNLLDVDYLAGIAGQGAWIGAPRTVVFTITTDF